MTGRQLDKNLLLLTCCCASDEYELT